MDTDDVDEIVFILQDIRDELRELNMTLAKENK
jgi:hypothetical protein